MVHSPFVFTCLDLTNIFSLTKSLVIVPVETANHQLG
jgi:hypothetical protein